MSLRAILICIAALPALAAGPPEGAKDPSIPHDQGQNHEEFSGVDWKHLLKSSGYFLATIHAFRYANEPDTRADGVGIGRSYLLAIGNLHGWNDGDPYYVNYVAHPMEGAISGRIFELNDRRYSRTEFGQNPEYWRGKLRAAAFAWAYSEQFEIGLVSEATIGHVQAHYPQQGFVDHIITPSVGLAWMIGEDILDKYVIVPLESRSTNKWKRLLLRTTLNPGRSFANLMDGHLLWDRATRGGILEPAPESHVYMMQPPDSSAAAKPAPFEFSVAPTLREFTGGGCLGGGAEAAYRVAPQWQILLDVNGCKSLSQPADFSGDALIYQTGLRWTPLPAARWSPHVHVLIGGLKVTREQVFPDLKKQLLAENQGADAALLDSLHDLYTQHEEASGLALTLGGGLDYKLNSALALRLADIDYLWSGASALGRLSAAKGLAMTTGLVLRLGTW